MSDCMYTAQGQLVCTEGFLNTPVGTYLDTCKFCYGDPNDKAKGGYIQCSCKDDEGNQDIAHKDKLNKCPQKDGSPILKNVNGSLKC